MVTTYYNKKPSLKPANVSGTEAEPGDRTPASSCPGSAWTAFRSSRDDAGSTRGHLSTRETHPSLPVRVLSGPGSRARNTHVAGLPQPPAPRCQHRYLGLHKPPCTRALAHGGRRGAQALPGRSGPALSGECAGPDRPCPASPPLHTRIGAFSVRGPGLNHTGDWLFHRNNFRPTFATACILS